MISDHEKDLIFTMRELGATFNKIALKLGKKEEAVKKYFQRNYPNRHLPPKVKTPKLLTNGRIGLAIKKGMKEDPKATSRGMEQYLTESFGPNIRTPKKSTINKFLLTNNLKIIK